MLWTLTKRMEISSSHHLKLPYSSRCQNVHGHNWIVTVEIQGRKLNKEDMLLDFQIIKQVVNEFDHTDINALMEDNPTAENIAALIAYKIHDRIDEEWEDKGFGVDIYAPSVTKVTVQESEGNIVCYTP